MRRRLSATLSYTAPLLFATALMVAALAAAVVLTQGATRDVLIGTVVGGLVTLVATVGAQEMRARAERRERDETRSREEVAILSALARELLEASAYLNTAIRGPSAGSWRLLPVASWTAYHLRLGEFWHPHEVARLHLDYTEIALKNEVLRELGAPADHTSLFPPRPRAAPELLAAFEELDRRINAAVARLNRRGDVLARKHGWPAKSNPDDPDYRADASS